MLKGQHLVMPWLVYHARLSVHVEMQFYETGLVDKKLWPFGEDLRKRFEQTRVSPLIEALTALLYDSHYR